MGKIGTAALACAAAFVLLAAGLLAGWWDTLDRSAANAFADMHRDSLTPLFKAFSEIGSTAAFAGLFAITAIVLLLRKRYRETAALLLATGGAYALNSVLKQLFARERPPLLHLIEADGYGFPSGNAMVGLAFYGMLAVLVWRSSLAFRRGTAAVLLLLVLLIGVGRLYLNVHYPTDILAGYTAGGAWLLLSARLTGLSKRTASASRTDRVDR